MKVKIKFGYDEPEKFIFWDKKIEDFPKLLRYRSKKWEQVTYSSTITDYEIIFSEIPSFDPTFYVTMDSFEELFPKNLSECECGANFSSFSWDHLRFCKMWRPW